MKDKLSINKQIQLRDSRLLGYAEYGDPAGRPLFFFHGIPSSRYQGEFAHEIGKKLGVKIIGLDRPGYGLSSFQPNRSISDWPRDVEQLIDHLEYEKVSLVGSSGGGPYVLACAAQIPHRIAAAGIVSGMGPIEALHEISGDLNPGQRRIFQTFRRHPNIIKLVLALTASSIKRDPQRFFALYSSIMSPRDKKSISRPRLTRIYIRSIIEGFRQGTRGPYWDGMLYARPWNFRLEDISLPIHLWHGKKDRSVPFAFGKYVAKRLPHCHAKFLPQEGHFSVVIEYLEQIIAELIS